MTHLTQDLESMRLKCALLESQVAHCEREVELLRQGNQMARDEVSHLRATVSCVHDIVCVHVCVCVCMCMCVYVCVYVCVFVNASVLFILYMHVCVCVHACTIAWWEGLEHTNDIHFLKRLSILH